MYQISVSNGILDPKHRLKMQLNQKTSCIWVYLWLLDKITKIDLESGLGKVLGGKPITVDELADFGDRKTVMKILKKLEDEGYIKTTRTPYGKVICVTKAKKSFGRKVERSPESGTSESTESGTSQVNNLVHLRSESGTSNKTIQLDNTVDNIPEQSSANKDIAFLIDLFKVVNPSYKKLFGSPPQRKAAGRLIEAHGLDRLKAIINFLPRSNITQYMPVITTPCQLEDKFGQLAASWQKAKNHEPLIL